MARARHIGIIGFGAIGRDLYAHLASDPDIRMTVLLRETSNALKAVPSSAAVATSLPDFIASKPDIVVEAAGQAAVGEYVPELLRSGIPVIVASTGALGDASLLHSLAESAGEGRATVTIPAGALGGLDYLVALRSVPDAQVRYTSRKPPAAWDAELRALRQDPQALAAEFVLFEGAAAEAARRYPRNLNAGLTVALAAGADRTIVRAVADPAARHNTHEIAVESSAGSASMTFANRPSAANPKTSALTALSLAAAVRRHFASIII
jgi:aspartate dehydrogenase